MKEFTLSNNDIFDTGDAARAAFYRKELRWALGESAYTWQYRHGSNVLSGHRKVKIKEVFTISAEGAPVYGCEALDGEFISLEDDVLFTKEQLLKNQDGSESAYSIWLRGKQAEVEKRRARMIDDPIPVTGLLDW